MPASAPALESALFIDGRELSVASGGRMEHRSAATGAVQAEVPVAGPAEVGMAVDAARRALPGWATDPALRATVLRRIASELRADTDIGPLMPLENGTPIAFGSMMAAMTADWFEYYSGWADKIHGDVIPVPGAFDFTAREPAGVIAVILTWNGPVPAIGFKVAAALAAGCTVVVKPPELAPFSTTLFARACARAGVPNGVVNVVTGDGDIGEALVRHPDVDLVTFTGGTATGKRIHAACNENLTPVVLELGGKSASILFEDAMLDHAVMAAGMAIVALSGQVCLAPTRLLVHSSRYSEVVDRLSTMLRSIRPGDPRQFATVMGPLISETAGRRVLDMIGRAVDAKPASYCWAVSAVTSKATSPAVGTYRRLSSARSTPTARSHRKRRSGRCCRSSSSKTRTRRSLSPTAPATGWPPTSTQRTCPVLSASRVG